MRYFAHFVILQEPVQGQVIVPDGVVAVNKDAGLAIQELLKISDTTSWWSEIDKADFARIFKDLRREHPVAGY